MEWDAKMHSWDMPELGLSAAAAANSCLGTLVGTSNRRADGADCSVDLKLGGLGEFVPATDWNDQFKVSKASAPSAPMPSSVPSKRARVQSNGGQVPACLVEGCMADLSKCREYHRRHKVCEAHSKTPVVIVAGQEQRFCQQCSRFHLLVEFDEVKRSCRKRLDGHNRRRRKPQPDSLNPGNLFANHQEARFSSYPQMLSTPFAEPKWASIVKTETDTLHGHYPPLHLNCTSLFHTKERKHFPFLTTESDTNAFDGRSINLQAAVCRPLSITPTGSSSNSSSSRSKMFMPGGTLNAVLDSECALSLLSSPTPTPAIHLGQMISSADQIPLAQPLVSELQYGSLQRMSSSQAASTDVSLTGFSCTRMDNKNLGSIPASHEAHDTGLQYQGLYHVNAEGHSDGAVHALPFSW